MVRHACALDGGTLESGRSRELRATAHLLGMLCSGFLSVGCPTGGIVSVDDDATGDDDTTDDDDDTGDDDDADGGLLARISVIESTEHGSGTESSSVRMWGIYDSPWADGVVPDWWAGCSGEGDTGVWVRRESAGDCWLAVTRTCDGDCVPPCEEEEYCTPTSVCEPIPELRDAGVLAIDGLSVQASLTPTENGRYSPLYGLPSDLYQPGDVITLTAEGGDTPAFSASAMGVDELEAELPCGQIPEPEQDLTVTWTPGGAAAVRVRWEMIQNVHLAQGPRLRCEVEDTGSLTIPAELIDAYLYSQHHTFTLSRYDVQEVSVHGESAVAFEVHSTRHCDID